MRRHDDTVYRSCSCPLYPDALSSRSAALLLQIALVVSRHPLLLACFDARSLSLLIDAPFSRTNELSTMRCCCRRSCFLYSSSFLFVALLEEKSEDGGSVYFLLVNCCWLSCCCRFLWISISRLMMCFLCCWVMFSIGYQGKEFV
jgi:hypothetical protein